MRRLFLMDPKEVLATLKAGGSFSKPADGAGEKTEFYVIDEKSDRITVLTLCDDETGTPRVVGRETFDSRETCKLLADLIWERDFEETAKDNFELYRVYGGKRAAEGARFLAGGT